MFPMKFFETRAGGTPGHIDAAGPVRDFRRIHREALDSRSFVYAIRKQSSDRQPPLQLDDPVLAENSCDARLRKVLVIINSAHPRIRACEEE
jgi:hypothetical protein